MVTAEERIKRMAGFLSGIAGEWFVGSRCGNLFAFAQCTHL